jgi:hypothetical protein
MKWLSGLVVITAMAVTLSGLLYPLHPDEVVYLGIGKAVSEGERLYVDVFDQKPPGIYVVAALSIKLFGDNRVWPRMLIAGVNWAIAWGIIKILKTIKVRGALVTGLGYVMIAPYFQGQFFLTEPFVVFLSIYSLLFIRRNTVCAGMFVGMALWFKQSAWAIVLAEGLYVFLYKKMHLRHWLVGVLFSGLGLWLYLFASGNLFLFWEKAGWFYPYNYPPTRATSWNEIILQVMMTAFTIGLLLVPSVARLYKLILLFSLPVLMYRPYHHYWLQILPFLILGFAQLIDHHCRIVKPLP